MKLPEAVVNGVVLRGQTGYGASLELNVATAICNGFTPGSRPKECDDIITPEGTLGQSGNAKVKFIASLGYVDMLAGGPLTSSSLSTTMVERFRSTLSMKLGVDPQVIQISKPDLVKSGSNSVTVNVQVSNLKCSDDGSSKSSKVVESLKGIATCEAEASSDAQVEAETKVGEKFYFHTAAAHGSTNRQVVSLLFPVTLFCLNHFLTGVSPPSFCRYQRLLKWKQTNRNVLLLKVMVVVLVLAG